MSADTVRDRLAQLRIWLSEETGPGAGAAYPHGNPGEVARAAWDALDIAEAALAQLAAAERREAELRKAAQDVLRALLTAPASPQEGKP